MHAACTHTSKVRTLCIHTHAARAHTHLGFTHFACTHTVRMPMHTQTHTPTVRTLCMRTDTLHTHTHIYSTHAVHAHTRCTCRHTYSTRMHAVHTHNNMANGEGDRLMAPMNASLYLLFITTPSAKINTITSVMTNTNSVLILSDNQHTTLPVPARHHIHDLSSGSHE